MESRATELKTNLEEAAAFLQSLMKYRIPFEKHKKASLLRAQLLHQLRASKSQVRACCFVGCELSCAEGSRCCEHHTTFSDRDNGCLVKGCDEQPSRNAGFLALCERHLHRFMSAKKPLEEWLSTHQENAQAPEDPIRTAIPYLGGVLDRSGLPFGIDPAPVEAVLQGEGLPLCIAGDCGQPRESLRVWCEAHAREIDTSTPKEEAQSVTNHQCPGLLERRWVRILYGPDVAEGWEDWLLEIRHTAGPQEVCDGEAEYVGEETFRTQFPIKYCPYCGHSLTQPGPGR